MRLLFPALGVFLVAFVIGCGGASPLAGGTDGTTDGTTAGTGTTSGDATGPMRAAAGTYTVALAGTRTTGGTVTGVGTGTSALDGSVNLTYTQTVASTTASRTLAAAVQTNGAAQGLVTEGLISQAFAAGTLSRQTNGTYTLLIATNDGTTEETDTFTLTATRPAAGTFHGVVGGTDNKGGVYSGTGTFTLASSGNITLSYNSRRTASGVGITQAHNLPTTLMADGTFTGTMSLGISSSVTVNGTWVLNSSGSVTLTLNYDNNSFFPVPTVAETITLTRS